MSRDGKRLTGASPAVEYHDLRIRAKRLRYSLEVFGELYGKPAERVASALKTLQDMLGDHQDAEVGIARLHAIVASHGHELPPATLVAVGRLIEQLRSEEHRLRADFPADFGRVLDRWRPLGRITSQLAKPKATALREDASPPVAADNSVSSERPADSASAPPTPSTLPAPPSDAAYRDEGAWRSPAPTPPLDLRAGPGELGTLSRMRQLFHRE